MLSWPAGGGVRFPSAERRFITKRVSRQPELTLLPPQQKRQHRSFKNVAVPEGYELMEEGNITEEDSSTPDYGLGAAGAEMPPEHDPKEHSYEYISPLLKFQKKNKKGRPSAAEVRAHSASELVAMERGVGERPTSP
jgi:hypothetical protein